MPSLQCYFNLASIKPSYDQTSYYVPLFDSSTNEKVGCIISTLNQKSFGDNDNYLLVNSSYTIYNLNGKGQGSFSITSVLGGNMTTVIPTNLANKTGDLDGSFVVQTNKVTVFSVPDLTNPTLKVNVTIKY